MNLLPDLFSFAYVPGWYCQLDELAGLALPEPWRFRNPDYHTKNPDTPILERYIHSIFKKQVIDFNEERNPEKAAEGAHRTEHCGAAGLPRKGAVSSADLSDDMENPDLAMTLTIMAGII